MSLSASSRSADSSATSSAQAVGVAALLGFVGCVFGANWLIANVGYQVAPGLHVIPVGLDLTAPSGVVAVGLSLTLRDAVHATLGPRACYVGIAIGAVLSALISPALAVASAAAFSAAESADMAIFTALKRAPLPVRAAASNGMGALVDSAVFLSVAFGGAALAEFGVGQFLGKVEWSLVALPVLVLAARRRSDGVRRR